MRSLTTFSGVAPLPPFGVAPAALIESTTKSEEMAGAQDTIYLCNFRVSVDGEWLCLKELHDMDQMQISTIQPVSLEKVTSPDDSMNCAMIARDPVVIERSNLVNICKLIVKELIEQSLRFGRMLDSDHLPLRHFFIVLEHVLRHGLKPKKGLLGPKKELWDILQMVEKYAPEAQDITASVRDLPTVRTAMGRARAWLRVALMQKRLADYMRVLLEHRDETLEEYFEPHALMLNEEATIITGLLVGLNVVDCNLCVKEEDLDSQQGVIDFSLYLRGTGNGDANAGAEPKQRDITTMLDQKNYIEELNRHLNATVTNLQAKVESLTTTNALMKEDLAIANNQLIQISEENNQLKHALGQDLHKDDRRLKITEIHSEEEEKALLKASSKTKVEKQESSESQKILEEERNTNLELQKELDLQMSLKAEMEVAMKLLEKDIHDKQDTIISLRRQLDDIKLINLEMYKKLQDCESSVKHKSELILKLEAKTESMANTIQQLDDKVRQETSARRTSEEGARSAGQRAAAADARAAAAEGDLRLEKEWKTCLQETMVKDREKISQLSDEIESLKVIGQKYVHLREEQHVLRGKYAEAQRTLEEVGATLSSDRLRLAELMEANTTTPSAGRAWADDRDAAVCSSCDKEFNITRRKHHCRRCGDIFCAACSERTAALAPGTRPVRVCDACHAAAATPTPPALPSPPAAPPTV